MIQDIHGGWNPAALQAALPLRPQGSSGGTTSVAAATTSRDVDASLSITTKEGDTFSISASFDTTATYAGVRGRGVRAGAWSLWGSSQLSFQVKGNLNTNEMKDIARVVRTFLHDLRAMLGGRDVSIANVAGGDPQSLQSVAATATTRTSVTAVAGSIVRGPLEIGDGPRPWRHAGGDADHHRDGDVDSGPVGTALPLPAPEPFTTAGAASPA